MALLTWVRVFFAEKCEKMGCAMPFADGFLDKDKKK